MSLRLRLTLIYIGLLSGVVLLLSIVVYSMVSVILINQVDDILQSTADHVIETMRADSLGDIAIDPRSLNISNRVYYQVWSVNDQLLGFSDNAQNFTTAMDPEAIGMAEPVFREVRIQDTAYRVLTVPLEVDDEDSGWLQIGLVLTDLHFTQRLLQIVFGISAVFTIAVAGIVGWLVTAQALEPLVTMADVATQITSTDDLSQRIPIAPGRSDEIGKLVLNFNQTLVRLERLFNAQRRFLADVGHELRTPLTVIKGNVGLMRMMREFDDESLASIESEVDRLTRLVGDLLLMAQAETGRLPLMFEPVELDEIVFEVFEQMTVLSAGRHRIQIGHLEPALVTGDRDRLKQVLLNLGSNAIKFTPEGGEILLNLSVNNGWVQVAIQDHGPGIPKEELRHIFERFYRGDKSRNRSRDNSGFGLGLPIAYWIIRNHGGRIDAESKIDVGTVFTVWLPVSQAEIPTRPLRD
ncbi:MAG: HAMP domain-containing sensor histidine kinase [Chloroflexota bacterium]|nr:HAMP domain-containing sensor histidine kinase [Chloroflexota bacterium]